MKKQLIVLSLAAIASISSYGEQLSPAQAIMRLQSLEQGPNRAPARNWQSSPAYVSAKGNINTFYVFNSENKEGGYVILSADDVAAPLLGYADSGAFDAANIPPNMAWWLSQYEMEINWAIEHEGVLKKGVSGSRRATRSNISPLVTAKWDQGDPYNQECPLVGGNRSVTGCVATAMAQIMYYHQWPQEAGKGSYSYSWTVNGQSYSDSMDFGQVTFDWTNMLDSYNDQSTQTQKDAVAKLMHACGVSTKMGYTPNESSTQSSLIAWALTEFFDYDKSMQYLPREAYSRDEWETLIYNELAAGRPVQYSGRTLDNAGHAFVCDGYRNGFFHINWGWGGMSDGFFLTSALDPAAQGIGGAQSGLAFVTGQRIIIGIQKNKGTAQRPEPTLTTSQDLTVNGTSFSLSNSPTFTFGPYNSGYVPFFGEIGLKFQKVEGGDAKYSTLFNVSESNPLLSDYYYIDARVSISARDIYNLLSGATGDYYVTLSYKYQGSEWKEVVANPTQVNRLKMTLSASSLQFSAAPDMVNLSFDTPTPQTPFYIDRQFSVKATASLESEYCNIVWAAFLTPGTNNLCGYGNNMHVTLSPTSEEIIYTSQLCSNKNDSNQDLLSPGTYDLVLVNSQNQIVSPRLSVTVESDPGEPTFEFSDLKLENGPTPSKDNIQISGKISCTSGYFDDAIKVGIYTDTQNFSDVTLFSSDFISVKKGETKDFSITCEFTDGIPGNKYLVAPIYQTTIYPDHGFSFTLYSDQQPVEGDVNGDKVVDMADINSTADYIMERPVDAQFSEEAADLNKDGRVSGIDLNTVASRMLAQTDVPTTSSAEASLSMADASAMVGTEATVAVKANAPGSLLGFQCDITVPEGLELVEGSFATPGTDDHILDVAKLGSGKTRVLAYSPSLKTLNTPDGSHLLTFKVKVNAGGSHQIGITGAELDGTGLVMHPCADATASVTGTSSQLAITPSTLTVKAGESTQLTLTGTPEGSVIPDLEWTSSNADIASVDSEGNVTAHKGGTATITASSATGLQATCEVTVEKLSQEITWEQTFGSITEGSEITLTAQASSDLEIAYSITQGSDLATLNGSVLTLRKAGAVTIRAEQAGNDMYEAAAPVEKLIDVITGLEAADVTLQPSAWADGNAIAISGEGLAQVFNVSGLLIYSGHDHRIPLAPGIYFVSIDGQIFKVAL